LISNISRNEQDVDIWKTVVQTTIPHAYDDVIWWSLVYKRQQTGQEFGPIQGRPLCYAVHKYCTYSRTLALALLG